MEKIDTKARRATLAARREPYFQRIIPGLFVGVRVSELDRSQTWIARFRNPHTGKQVFNALGALADVSDDKRYAAAVDLAKAFAENHGAGAINGEKTVWHACLAYVDYVRTDKGGQKASEAALTSLTRTLKGDPFASVPVGNVTRAMLLEHRASLVVDDPEDEEELRRSRASVIRKYTYVVAALNHAVRLEWVDNAGQWTRLGAWKGIHAARKLTLSPAELHRLFSYPDAEFSLLMRGLYLTAFRVGELAHLRVKDFDARRGLVHIGKSKTGARTSPLSADAVALFKGQCKDKLPEAFIFTQANGVDWTDSNHRNRKSKQAAAHAGVSSDFCLYNLRHAAITRMIDAGVDVTSVSKLAGTSPQMIEKTYEHVALSNIADKISKVAML